ncbi:MAG: class D sortase [Janthinobacterium lividum]
MNGRVRSGRERIGTACRWVGVLLLAAWLLPYLYGTVSARLGLARFQSEHAETISWAPGRVSAYRRALRVAMPMPEAVLRIPSADLEVPVLEGTSDPVLNRAVGHITGTSPFGSGANIVLAGHRDGFFRRLKNVAVGDRIEVARAGGVDTYRVDELKVVDRNDTSALRPTHTPTLTLVTCYPFVYLGAAPQRYIVRASPVAPLTQPNL